MVKPEPTLEASISQADGVAPPAGPRLSTWVIALFTTTAIAGHLLLHFGTSGAGRRWAEAPLVAVLLVGGVPLVAGLARKALRGEFGSDLLAGVSIVTSALLGEHLAGAFVVLMLSGGEALEAFAVRRASSVLSALAKRLPASAHRKCDGGIVDIPLSAVAVGDILAVFPHETCPVDGVVIDGHGVMDEAYLTGEPYEIPKAPGAAVLSGAVNGAAALSIQCGRLAADSRYAQIMQVMRESEQARPRMRRLGDQLGAGYTPLAMIIAMAAWAISRDPTRFLAVLVVATPCPLLIAIPVAIIGAISLAARRRIIIRDPAVLEKVDGCTTAIFDKTGTLTYGRPSLTKVIVGGEWTADDILAKLAALERYSKHPLSKSIVAAAERLHLVLPPVSAVREPPGRGLMGTVAGCDVEVTHRKAAAARSSEIAALLPPIAAGLECIVFFDGRYAGTLQFRDEPRTDTASFIQHLGPRHRFERVLLLSGDRMSEVEALAKQVGITEVFASQSPEQKLEIVRAETRQAPTIFMGDGINDAPALTAATVGIAFGQYSDVAAQAAGAVILDSQLETVDEFLHISRRLRRVVLESAVGGMSLSVIGMFFAAAGMIPPVTGAILQEIIDAAAIGNALRVAIPPRHLADFN